jgi:hypothetical protein
MELIKQWILGKLLKGQVYIGEGAKITYSEKIRIDCYEFYILGSIEEESSSSIHSNVTEYLPRKNGVEHNDH